jgi:hypothetical protein
MAIYGTMLWASCYRPHISGVEAFLSAVLIAVHIICMQTKPPISKAEGIEVRRTDT